MAKLSPALFGLIILMAYQQSTLADLSQDIDEFHGSLYEKFVKSSFDKNVLFSPLCIELGLGMLRLAAEGTTANELDKVAKFSSRNPEQTAEDFKKLLDKQIDNLVMANKIYIRRNVTPKQEYIDALTNKFKSTIESINVSDATDAAVTVNKWVTAKTNNNIRGTVSSDMFVSDFDMLIINYIYLKSKWRSEFKKEVTTNRDFHLNDGTTVSVPMMKQTESFDYAELADLGAQALRMDFKGGELSMLILLPNNDTNLKNVVEKLRNTPIQTITLAMEPTNVIVTLPKFQIEFEQDLTPILKELGLNRVFSNDAELGNMLESNNKAKVSQILHKAVMTVHEGGTEIQAGVSVGGPLCLKNCEPPTFTADSPFYYAILDMDDVVIFAGHVVNP